MIFIMGCATVNPNLNAPTDVLTVYNQRPGETLMVEKIAAPTATEQGISKVKSFVNWFGDNADIGEFLLNQLIYAPMILGL